MDMDPGNCFQLLDSQASRSDQLYCHTMSSYAIHTQHCSYHILANTHTRSGGHWSLVLTTDYCAQQSPIIIYIAAASKGIDQAPAIGNGRNISAVDKL